MTSKIVTMIVTITPTMVSRIPAIAEMIAMMPAPMAETMEPICENFACECEGVKGLSRVSS